MIFDLQASYRDATIELAVHGQIADSPAVVATFAFFQQTYQFHRFNLWCARQCPHIHRGKIRTQSIKLSGEFALYITDQVLDRGVFLDCQQFGHHPAARLRHAGNIVSCQID